ncbi:MAG: hypothetical protein IJ461_08165, partial [Clostridia bacterium]|nr:hypothetical protein [Clostridia bacterium]
MVNYKSVKSGKVTIKNDGVIRGLTGAGVILAPFDGTTMSLTGSGVVEGPVGLILCANSAPGRATVTIDHTLRSCNARLEAEADQRADFWLELKKQANQLGLLTPSDEEAMTAQFQRKVREAQIDQLLERTGMTHEDAMGRALCISQGAQLPYNLKLTLKGTLWGEEGLITLPDMNQKKGTLSVKAQAAPDSPAKRVDIVYTQYMLDINETAWPQKLNNLVNGSFSKAWQQGVDFCTRTVKATEDGGAVYTSSWAGPAMVELTARHTGGKWQVASQDLPSPGENSSYEDVLDQLSGMAANSLYLMEKDVPVTSTDNTYRAAYGPYLWEGNGYSFGTPFESESFKYAAVLRLPKALTIRNFKEFGKLHINGIEGGEGSLTLSHIGSLGPVSAANMDVRLSNVTLAPYVPLALTASNKGEYEAVIDESCLAPQGELEINCGNYQNEKCTLKLVNEADLLLDSGNIVVRNKGVLKLMGAGSLGDWENAQSDQKTLVMYLANGGQATLDHRISTLELRLSRNDQSAPKAAAQIGGQVKHLMVKCEESTPKDTITVTASQMETFKVELYCDGRTEPMTDKEAASFIKKNAPTLKYTKARSAGGEGVTPVYEIKGDQHIVLWMGSLK